MLAAADETAHRIADLVLAHPGEMGSVLRAWSTEANLWLRRVSIIGQLGLREVARWNPGWVTSYVATHELSPLSQREALKHLS